MSTRQFAAWLNPVEIPNTDWRNGVRLGHWDESPLRLSSVGGDVTNYNANKGVNNDMVAVRADGTAPSQVMKAYPNNWETNYATSQVQKSAEFGHAFVTTQRMPGSLTDIVAGVYDDQIAAWFNSIPVTETAYTSVENEPDNANRGFNPTDFCQATGRIINIGAPIMRSRGLQGGIGTILMFYLGGTSPTTYFNTWNYLQYVDPANMGQVVYGLDRYSKFTASNATTYESVPDLSNLAFDQARALGCTRFGIGEFGISKAWRDHAGAGLVATSADQKRWLETEMPKICSIEDLEFAIYFHKPSGTESMYDQLLDDTDGNPFTTYANMI